MVRLELVLASHGSCGGVLLRKTLGRGAAEVAWVEVGRQGLDPLPLSHKQSGAFPSRWYEHTDGGGGTDQKGVGRWVNM